MTTLIEGNANEALSDLLFRPSREAFWNWASLTHRAENISPHSPQSNILVLYQFNFPKTLYASHGTLIYHQLFVVDKLKLYVHVVETITTRTDYILPHSSFTIKAQTLIPYTE